jgi:hypothetical protein
VCGKVSFPFPSDYPSPSFRSMVCRERIHTMGADQSPPAARRAYRIKSREIAQERETCKASGKREGAQCKARMTESGGSQSRLGREADWRGIPAWHKECLV